MRALILAVGFWAALSGCARQTQSGAPPPETENQAAMLEIAGALSYRERIALTPDAVAYISFEDISGDGAPRVIVEQRIALNGRQVPVSFLLAVQRDAAPPGLRYALRGSIKDGAGALLWTTVDANSIDVTLDVADLGVVMMTRANP